MLSCFGHVWLFVTPWTIACQAPLSMGILQARIMEGVAMPSPRGSSGPRDWIWISYVSCIGQRVLYHNRHFGSPYNWVHTGKGTIIPNIDPEQEQHLGNYNKHWINIGEGMNAWIIKVSKNPCRVTERKRLQVTDIGLSNDCVARAHFKVPLKFEKWGGK